MNVSRAIVYRLRKKCMCIHASTRIKRKSLIASEIFTTSIQCSSLSTANRYTHTHSLIFVSSAMLPGCCKNLSFNQLLATYVLQFLITNLVKKTLFTLKSQRIYLSWCTFFCIKLHTRKINFFSLVAQCNISNRINFCLKSNKSYLWPYTNALIYLIWKKIYFIETNIYLAQRYFVWIKQI